MDTKSLVLGSGMLVLLACGSACDKEEVDLDQPPLEAVEKPGLPAPEALADAGSRVDAGEADASTVTSFKEDGDFAGVPLEGLPIDEDPRAVKILFLGEEAEFPLYRNYGNKHRVSSRFLVNTGQEIGFKRSIVLINKPRLLTVTEDFKTPGTEYDTARQRFGEDQVIEFKKGDRVELLKSAGEGACFIGFGTTVYTMKCPEPDHYEGEDWAGETTPLETEWWILASVQASRGWMVVDGEDFTHTVDQKLKRRFKKKKRK